MSQLLIGAIADDFTGATDLANNLVRAGMRVVQTIGVPDEPLAEAADAVVVALKSRTLPAPEAVEQSLAALRWLVAQGAQQIYFKVCSTFDSTPRGNIGPVLDKLMDATGCDFTIATPAFPDNGRSVFMGHLFVGDQLLSESGMRDHPLTPMTDANLVRVLQAQSRHRVGLVERSVVAQGPGAIAARMAQLKSDGVAIAIVDAVSNADLVRIGPALKHMPVVCAGSGLAIALPHNFGILPSLQATALPTAQGHRAVVAGSCSLATQRQVNHAISAGIPTLAVNPQQIAYGSDVAAQALAWAAELLPSGPVLVYSTADAATLKASQTLLGAERSGELVEHTLATIAHGLVDLGVGRLIVAGGETSGACVQALGIRQLRIGAQIDPGVPWCHAVLPGKPHGLHLSLKSGNFGSDDFFTKAFALA